VTPEESLHSSNSIRLSWREWGWAALAAVSALYLVPAILPAAGVRMSRPDYRLPTELSSDYWMFQRWARYSRGHHRAVVLGDSVVWGQYAASDGTLTHCLNSLLGAPVFANLGVDGLHPAAMAGMVRHYGGALHGLPVIVHLNPLWMMSDEQDLRTRGEARFNHPKLVAQFLDRPGPYHPSLGEAGEAVLERYVPFLRWREHIKIAYYGGMPLQEWSLDNPYTLLPDDGGPDALSSDDPGSLPVDWVQRGIRPQDAPWVAPADSYQWRCFTAVIDLLRSRGNRVFVLVGPFNTHALTEASRHRYRAVLAAMAEWLERERIPYYAPEALPSELYADASHPLAEGYRKLAEQLLESPSFLTWMGAWAPDLRAAKDTQEPSR